MTEPQPISETPFKNDKIVICGKCQGRKTIVMFEKVYECPVCRGAGVLHKVTEGIVKIYLTV